MAMLCSCHFIIKVIKVIHKENPTRCNSVSFRPWPLYPQEGTPACVKKET
jgi:hypothetical protein